MAAVTNIPTALTGVLVRDHIELDQDTFLPFISGNPSLGSLSLSHCNFPDRAQLSQATPVELPELKTLQLMGIQGLSGFSSLIHAPALKTLSSLRISVWRNPLELYLRLLIHAESGDGFQLSYDAPDCRGVTSGWPGITDSADPCPAFIHFGGTGDRRSTGSGDGSLTTGTHLECEGFRIQRLLG